MDNSNDLYWWLGIVNVRSRWQMVVVSGIPLSSQEGAEFDKTLVFNPPFKHSPDDWQAVF